MFKWFDVRKELEFAESLASFFANEIQLNYSSSKNNNKQIVLAFEKMKTMADQYKNANQLSFYKRARLGNKVMWLLRDAGYDESIVREFSRQLIIRLGK